MKVPNVWSTDSSSGNIFKCEPCPKCSSDFRFILFKDPEVIICEECDFSEEMWGPYWNEWKKQRGIK